MSDRDWVIVDGVKYVPRNQVIEECARVADGYAASYSGSTPEAIAAAIRELKDKP